MSSMLNVLSITGFNFSSDNFITMINASNNDIDVIASILRENTAFQIPNFFQLIIRINTCVVVRCYV